MIDYAYVAIEEISADFTPTARTVQRVAELTDRIAYNLISYAPAIPPLRARDISGGGDYSETSDTIQLDVLGDTASQCTANYEALIDLIDQAGRWWAGEAVNIVRLAAQVRNSAVGTLYAQLLGAPEGQPPLQASPEITYIDGCQVWIIRGVTLALLRRGRWLGAYNGGGSASTTAATNPAIGTLTLASGPKRSPIAVTSKPDTSNNVVPQWVALSGDVNGIQIFDMSTRTAAGFTTVADAASRPLQGTNILRYTPASTAYATSGNVVPATITQEGTYAVLAAVRTNGAQAFLIRPRYVTVVGRATVIDTTITTPQIISLGTISIGAIGAAAFDIQVAAISTSGGPTLDISYIALINLSLPNTFLFYAPTGAAALETIRAYHYETVDARKSQGGRFIALAGYLIDEAQGDLDLTMAETTVYMAAFAQASTLWTVPNAAGTNKDGWDYSVTRRNAYRSPQ